MIDAYVITRLCQDCLHGDCVDVCPVDCIVKVDGEFPNQLFITEDCISCGCCVPECPEEAIFAPYDVPAEYEDDIELNQKATANRPNIRVPSRLDLIEMLQRKDSAA